MDLRFKAFKLTEDMAKDNHLGDFLTDIANAIRAKKGTNESINAQDFADEIASIEAGGGSKWTGRADAEGLKAIGWTDEDIAYYQENGVNWNAEDDVYHKVTDDNKALYGVLTADNIQTYKDRIVYLPKIDTSAKTSMRNMFGECSLLVAIPQLDTSKVTDMSYMFYSCYSLTHANLKNANLAYDLSKANLLSKESLLFLINNEAATSAITIKLASYAYTRLAEDADIVAALANHPNISISK